MGTRTRIPGVVGHQAPVDTTGMDPEMKRTLGVGKSKPVPTPTPADPLSGVRKVVGEAVKEVTTNAKNIATDVGSMFRHGPKDDKRK